MTTHQEVKVTGWDWKHFRKDPGKLFQFTALVRQGLSVIVGILLVKLSFEQYQIGIYEMWMFLGLIFTLLCLSGSMQALGTIFHKWPLDERSAGLWTVYWFSLLGSSLLALMIWTFRDSFIPFLFKQSQLIALGPVLIYLTLHLVSGMIPYVLLVQERKWPSFAGYIVLLVVVQIPVFILVGLTTRDLTTLAQYLIIGAVIEQLLLLYLLICSSKLSFSPRRLYRFGKVVLPLTGLAGMGYAAQLFDTWLVNAVYRDPEIYAVFRYGAREIPGAVALASAFSTAMIVLLTKDVKQSLERIKQGTRRALQIFTPLALLLMLTSSWIFEHIYSSDYVPSALVFNCYLLIGISRWIFPHSILIARDRYKILTSIALLELLVNILLSILLVRYFGLVGIAIATVFAFALEKMLLILFVNYREQIAWHNYIPIRLFLISALSLVLTFLVQCTFFGHPLL